MKNYFTFDFSHFRGDLFGGLTAGIVALPLALAFGVSSGLGPSAGLYGAIFVSFFAAFFPSWLRNRMDTWITFTTKHVPTNFLVIHDGRTFFLFARVATLP